MDGSLRSGCIDLRHTVAEHGQTGDRITARGRSRIGCRHGWREVGKINARALLGHFVLELKQDTLRNALADAGRARERFFIAVEHCQRQTIRRV